MTLAFDMTIPEKFAQALSPLHPQGPEHAAAAALRLYLDLGELGVKALQARARHEGMSEADVIMHLLANPVTATSTPTATPSATTMTPRAAVRQRHETQARDLQIAQEYFEGGITYARLAAKHGLSTVRIAQIIAHARAQQERI